MLPALHMAQIKATLPLLGGSVEYRASSIGKIMNEVNIIKEQVSINDLLQILHLLSTYSYIIQMWSTITNVLRREVISTSLWN